MRFVKSKANNKKLETTLFSRASSEASVRGVLQIVFAEHDNRLHNHLSFTVEMYKTLFPRINASPYLFLSCPFTYSWRDLFLIR
jgi:hypothetical protein